MTEMKTQPWEAPAERARVVHLGRFITVNGGVSAYCFRTPHSIDLRKGTWTNRPEAATCKKCLDVYVWGWEGSES
jgi:hypothetical protein